MLLLPCLIFLCGLISHVSAESPDAIDWRVLGSSARYWEDIRRNTDVDNTTGDHGALGKRVPPTIADFATKGLLFDCLMQNTQATVNSIAQHSPYLSNKPMVSPFTSAPGWTISRMEDFDLQDFLSDSQDARNALGGGAQNNNEFGGVQDMWRSPTVEDIHGVPTTFAGFYANVYGWTSGTILAATNGSPTANAQDDDIDPSVYGPLVPQPSAWSDLVFLRWAAICHARNVPVGSLQHIFRLSISNTDTLAILNAALPTPPVSWANKAAFGPAAPGATSLTAENNVFYALLATPNLLGVCWMLIQHKSQLGVKFIDQAYAWTQNNEWFIYVHIADWTPP